MKCMELKKIISMPTEKIEIFEIEKYLKISQRIEDDFCQDSIMIENNSNYLYEKIVEDDNTNLNDKKKLVKIDFDKIINNETSIQPTEFNKNIKCTILDNLVYDRRIKNIEKINNYTILTFWSIKESISFYKHYYHFLNMKFSRYDGFSYKSRNGFDYKQRNDLHLSILRCTIEELKPEREKTTIVKTVHIENTENEFNDFNERIVYFCNLSKHFSVNDFKNIEVTIQENNYELLFNKTKELAVGIATNVIFQKTVSQLSQEKIEEVVDRLRYDLAPMSSTKYGAYSIQNLINSIKTVSAIDKIKKYFQPYIIDLFKHPIGNYTMQRILRLENEYIFYYLSTNFLEILSDELGYKVFKSCLESFKDKNEILKELVDRNLIYFDQKKSDELVLLLTKINCK